jgi:hypothetical protein
MIQKTGYTVFAFTINSIEMSNIADYLFDSKCMQGLAKLCF